MEEKELEKEVLRQYNILKRGCEEIINEAEFKEKLRKSIKTNTPLKVKFGIDPTGSDLHIGHAVPLRKLKQFQDLGHEPIFLIGTFTARIGDPTGKSETRKMLGMDVIEKNIKTYLDQLKLILDIDKLTVRYNHEWLESLNLTDVLNLLSKFTVSQMVAREDFSKRLEAGKPVSLIEFMYPILQGYDSVELNADVELGATEQKFNILRGRDLLKDFDKEPQICMLMPILVGLDGVEKMSKSLGNYIGVKDTPNDMFGKIMSISDDLMFVYYEQITDIPIDEIEEIKKNMHPMEAKKKLAMELIKIYYSEKEALEAREYFENVFSKKNLDVELPEVSISLDEVSIIDLLVTHLNFYKSTSEARRVITQGGFKVNDEAIKDISHVLKLEDGLVIKAGKKNIVRIKK
ncbi:tyrosine--tRNA ligase [Oceanivirga miroungae]|uniref:Tyrosine--tRNA ligase n=1 Tax=Oceanivirga miroungae TaxID=1130046 RepID=A0A6I8MC95_9FUSO|nr:tyrosine--tRNA ligase [Oceanivirga miroungae]VWL85846.1 tyrosyl-tRNA synthetase [Oceanivirga miroungae]